MQSKTIVALLAMSALALGSSCSSSVKVGPDAVAGLAPDATSDNAESLIAIRPADGDARFTETCRQKRQRAVNRVIDRQESGGAWCASGEGAKPVGLLRDLR